MRDLPRGTQVADLEVARFAYGAITLYGPPFLTGSTHDRLCDSSGTRQGPSVDSYNPCSETAAAYHAELVWAVPFSLATTQGIISFPLGTKMFQFPRFPAPGYFVPPVLHGHTPMRVSPFGHLRLKWLHTPHRSFSQCTTSFIGS